VGVLVLADRPGGYPRASQTLIDPFVQACGSLIHGQQSLRMQRRAERALRESEERFRLLVDGARDYALLMLDPYGRITSWNEGAAQLTGHDAEQAVGMHVSRFFPPEAACEADRELEIAMRDGRYEGEGERVRADGTRYWASTTLTALRDADGNLRGFAELARDFTARKQLDRMKDEFVSIVSHELRTPLTAIRGALGLLTAGIAGDLGPDATELVDLADSNCQRLVRLINDILDIQKIEAGKLTLRIGSVDPASVVSRTIDQMRAMAAESRVDLAHEVREPAAWQADEDRITQVVVNLISNAIKFSPAGGTVTVRVAPASPGRTRVSIADQGQGIPADKRGLLFGKFQQLDGSDSRKMGGTGLGLAICSEPGQGSVFWFELPLEPQASPAGAESA
jgi:PAS domain S-box-containing protein